MQIRYQHFICADIVDTRLSAAERHVKHRLRLAHERMLDAVRWCEAV